MQLLLLLNASLVIVGGLARRVLVEGNMPAQVVDYWEDVYGVGVYTSWAVYASIATLQVACTIAARI